MTGRGLARACCIRMCSGIWGRRGSTWASPNPCSAVLFDTSMDLKSSGGGGEGVVVSLGRSREHGGSRTGVEVGRVTRGGSGGTWVGSGGEGEGGG